MYTDSDLDLAVKRGIFTKKAVTLFREQHQLTTRDADEEQLRLLTSFNDIFVVIACALVLLSSYTLLGGFESTWALVAIPVLSWLLAEFFVRIRLMALPALVLLVSFIGGVFFLSLHLLPDNDDNAYTLASAAVVLAAVVHYFRFQVPVTVAIGVAATVGVLASSVFSLLLHPMDWALGVIFTAGFCTFLFAMYWDASDLGRSTRRSDIAFWLHLLASPMIVHPTFVFFGILKGEGGVGSIAVVILLYALMACISIIIDRKAFMVSSLLYVIYALTRLFEFYGFAGSNLAATGVCLGSTLLLLSAFWKPVRKSLVTVLPQTLQQYIPVAR
ncbi:hypothetical protein [Candidatus Sororendozoicomonas aggregata]|uniref:hypothetical protein n=1 Tax=Candidatus Sororendozoicomonas aggregata TaxID=3073239 RepID=UPI002ED4F746